MKLPVRISGTTPSACAPRVPCKWFRKTAFIKTQPVSRFEVQRSRCASMPAVRSRAQIHEAAQQFTGDCDEEERCIMALPCVKPGFTNYGYASTSTSWNMYAPGSRFRSLVASMRILSVV